MPYKVLSSDSEVLGRSIMATVRHINEDFIYELLEKHGLGNVQPDEWYPMQSWLDVFNEFAQAETHSTTTNFVGIGMAVVETAAMPPQFLEMPFADIMMQADAAYHMNNRGTEIGSYACEVLADNRIKLTITAPYPDDYNYGIVYGYARRFLDTDDFVVYYDEDLPRLETGGDATVIHVQWD